MAAGSQSSATRGPTAANSHRSPPPSGILVKKVNLHHGVKEINENICTVDLDNSQGSVKALKINVNAVGAKTQLSIRPERVTIDNSNSDQNNFKGKILELIYLGDHIRARLDVCGNNEFIVKVPNEGSFSHKEGDILNLSWNSDDVRALDI